MGPIVELIELPADYGRATRPLAWADVSRRLQAAPRYWLVTVRPGGKPHTVPVDGVWWADALYFGGSTATVHHRNLLRSPAAVVHLEDGTEAVVVEGDAELVRPSRPLAEELAAQSNAETGYGAPVEMFQSELWRLRPDRVLAWFSYPTDATRFRFRRPDSL